MKFTLIPLVFGTNGGNRVKCWLREDEEAYAVVNRS